MELITEGRLRMKFVTVEEMMAIEREADARGLTYEKMMENAGYGLAKIVHQEYSQFAGEGVLGLVGSGNNGGDTLVALEHLIKMGWRAAAYIVRPRPADDPLILRFTNSGGSLCWANVDADLQQLRELLENHRLALDGILGTGIRLPLKPELAAFLEQTGSLIADRRDTIIIAVDCPSGIDCDSGQAAPECLPADLTVTMAAYKQGLFNFPAYHYVGRVRLVSIGLEALTPLPEAWLASQRFVPDIQWVRQILPRRPPDAHKGTFGTAMIVAGSVNYTGAAWLAGQAAYRIGVGLVTMAIPQSLHLALAGNFPEATWLPLPEENGVIAGGAAPLIHANIQRVTAVLVGPGFGLRETTGRFLSHLIKSGGAEVEAKLPPLVIDADGLKLLADLPDWQSSLPSQAVLTPHPGEMSVLSGLPVQAIQSDRLRIAEEYARQWGHVLVLKGAFTVVASPQGQTAIIPVASPALARAGTGDVLAGLIVGLRAQGVEAFESAVAGAYIHAMAGLEAAKAIGNPAAVMAGDLLKNIPFMILAQSGRS